MWCPPFSRPAARHPVQCLPFSGGWGGDQEQGPYLQPPAPAHSCFEHHWSTALARSSVPPVPGAQASLLCGLQQASALSEVHL